ncbi:MULTISPECIES: YecR-like lipofamily protein [Pseudomonas]|uniref:YecR-like lipofamily protein n=1 Tax=Pseudomonas TaxID=286 RepID=UPI001E34EA69|nr:YecR-like lipofamily protein [Pseudomonas carnis]
MKSIIVAIALPLFAGCATPKYWEATGGNPSDGLVQLFYVRTPFEYAQIRESQGLAIATGRCRF